MHRWLFPLFGLLSFRNPNTSFATILTTPWNIGTAVLDPPEPWKSKRIFYNDDPNLSYSTGKPMKDWDEKRREWLKSHPSFAATPADDRILMVTGSQPKSCKSYVGDHLMGMFKNKVDYCRIHGYDIFYNNILFHPRAVVPGPKTRFSMLQCWLIPRSSGSGGLIQMQSSHSI